MPAVSARRDARASAGSFFCSSCCSEAASVSATDGAASGCSMAWVTHRGNPSSARLRDWL
ncbi:hypothetical protein TZ00_18405 [Agreia bicolorata]|uniref:Uncharacterized protein n=1 Tax=Agreia bicolorata TaxID=110935 RepID=A0ABR5CBC4_9MICO|nr:hypothetical protein TZ00_18405 [Agreia bicolorata]